MGSSYSTIGRNAKEDGHSATFPSQTTQGPITINLKDTSSTRSNGARNADPSPTPTANGITTRDRRDTTTTDPNLAQPYHNWSPLFTNNTEEDTAQESNNDPTASGNPISTIARRREAAQHAEVIMKSILREIAQDEQDAQEYAFISQDQSYPFAQDVNLTLQVTFDNIYNDLTSS